MSKKTRGSRQPELFPRSKRPTIPIEENHRLVELTDTLDWAELEARAEAIRASKLKNAAGRPPHLRALLGAMVLRATRCMPYRVLEDQIRHYAPARYLCGLTETDWSPDHNTLHDFIELMGEDGTRLINEYVVEQAVEEKLADPKVLVADTTAQEATLPYPNEIGLLSSFLTTVVAASSHDPTSTVPPLASPPANANTFTANPASFANTTLDPPPTSATITFLTSEGTDALAEELGEEFVQNVNGANDAASENREETSIEERGGPFVYTTGATEFADRVDGANLPYATREPRGPRSLNGRG